MTAQRSKKKHSDTTQGQEKMFAYLVSLSSNTDFVDRVKEIRQWFLLPEEGFKKQLKNIDEFVQSLPPYTNDRNEQIVFDKAIYDLADQFGVTLVWLNAIRDYIFYNYFSYAKTSPLVDMVDILGVLNDAERDGSDREALLGRILDNIADSFPLALLVSPYATGRDIIDFVKKEYKTQIEPAQSAYKLTGINIGKVRKRSPGVQERDMFICKHKHLGTRKIVCLVADEYGEVLDYTYINKIIKEKCKREK